MTIPEDKIIVALDFSHQTQVLNFFDQIRERKIWVKVGMELFYSLGPSIIHKAKERGFKVFLDLKLHDIPNTVGQSLKALGELPIDMVNVHAAGGKEMMKRAAESIKSSPANPLLIAVTQLTSTTTGQMNSEQGIPGEILESVLRFAELSRAAGCDGVVSSPHEVRKIKDFCGKDFLTVTPGIRPRGSENQDQKRITTPQEAILFGSDYIVIGRPITQSSTPGLALDKILKGE